jgi:hypothetical protein
MERATTTRRALLRNAAGLAAVLARGSSAAPAKQYFVYWGTYTSSDPRFGTGGSKGIYVSRFDSGTGKSSRKTRAILPCTRRGDTCMR